MKYSPQKNRESKRLSKTMPETDVNKTKEDHWWQQNCAKPMYKLKFQYIYGKGKQSKNSQDHNHDLKCQHSLMYHINLSFPGKFKSM